jgi:hypothetical protein
VAMSFGGKTCTTSATKITTSQALAITIMNNDASLTLYVGTDATVTTANGFPIPPQTAFTFDYQTLASATDYYGVAPSATIDARWIGRT